MLAIATVVRVRQVSHATCGAVSVEHREGVLGWPADGDVRDAISASAEHALRVDGASSQTQRRRRALQRHGQRPDQGSVPHNHANNSTWCSYWPVFTQSSTIGTVTKGFDARLANRPFLVWLPAFWRSTLSARVPESQKLKLVG